MVALVHKLSGTHGAPPATIAYSTETLPDSVGCAGVNAIGGAEASGTIGGSAILAYTRIRFVLAIIIHIILGALTQRPWNDMAADLLPWKASRPRRHNLA